MVEKITFLKLGGSLITEKHTPRTLRAGILHRLANEIALALAEDPALRLIIGHGSGSFGHVAAQKHRTSSGVYSPEDWHGFAEVWYEANLLNRAVIDSLRKASLSVISFPPSTGAITANRMVTQWDTSAMQAALEAGLIPVIQGDVVFDTHLGGAILSTEGAFVYLCQQFHPQRILLAGIEPGVWADFPTNQHTLPVITPQTWQTIQKTVQGSAAVDVTGGMRQKVQDMIQLIQKYPALQVLIFNGLQPGSIYDALRGNNPGTLLVSD